MHFAGEPEIAVLRQESFAPSPAASFAVCGAPLMCAERLWAVTARENLRSVSDFALAVEAEDAETKTKTFEDVISFPPPSGSSGGGIFLDEEEDSGKKFTTVPRRSHPVLGGDPKNLVISVRHSDGIFLIADADTGRGVGTGTLQLDQPIEEEGDDDDAVTSKKNKKKGDLVQTVLVDDQNQNTVIIFASTQQQVESGGGSEDCLSVMQLVVGSDPETNQPQLHVVLSAAIPQAIVVSAACPATDACLALALDGTSVELWARSVLFQQPKTGGGVDDSVGSIRSDASNGPEDLVHGRCTYEAARVGSIVHLCRDEGVQRSRIFGSTDRGCCIVFALSLKQTEGVAFATSSIRVLQSISVTDSPLTSAVCACSTVWFADAKGSVRIWSLDTLEELGTLDSSVEGPVATAEQQHKDKKKRNSSSSSNSNSAVVLPMSDLEFRRSLGVFRSSSLQSLAVKQAVAPAIIASTTASSPMLKDKNFDAEPPQKKSSPPPPTKSSPASQKSGKQQQQQSPTVDGSRSPSQASKASSSSSPAAKKHDSSLPTGPQANAAALSFIRQLCDVLARPNVVAASSTAARSPNKQQQPRGDSPAARRVAVPDRVSKAVPEAEYLEAALQSVAQSSGTIARCLPQLGLKPSTLTQDVASVCDIAVRMSRAESKLRQVVESLEGQCAPHAGEDDSDKEKKEKKKKKKEEVDDGEMLSTTDRLVAICQKLAVKHDNEMVKLSGQMEEMELKKQNEIDALEQRRGKEIAELRLKLAQQQQQQQQQKRGVSPPSQQQQQQQQHVDPKSEKQQQHPDEEEEEQLDPKELKRKVEKLSTELRSKSTLVKHLMQLTNDNGRVIEEMRSHSVQRRDECVDLRRVLRELDQHHTATVDGTVGDIDKMLATFSNPQSTSTSNLRSVVFMLQNLRQKLRPRSP